MSLDNILTEPQLPNASIKNHNGFSLTKKELSQIAETELNEIPGVCERELEALRLMVQSKFYFHSLQLHLNTKQQFLDDPNLTVPDYDQFLVRFLRARKFDSKKSFQMVSFLKKCSVLL